MTTTSIDGHHNAAMVLSRVAQAAQLRRDGLRWQDVADEVGYASRGAAANAVLTYLRLHAHENASALRDVENLRLDDDEQELLIIRDNPDLDPALRIRAIDARTRLSARRARLNGLDAPVAVTISAGTQALIADALAEAEELLAGESTVVSDERLVGRVPDE